MKFLSILRSATVWNSLNDYVRLKLNQRSIIRLAKSSNDALLINCKALEGRRGHIEHYYHFIFDLLLPLSFVIKKTPARSKFLIHDFGILSPMICKVFGNRITVISTDNAIHTGQQVDLIGMNPDRVKIHYFRITEARKNILSKLNSQFHKKINKILLIERYPPDPYYLIDANIKGSGTSRRSIENHSELESMIALKVSPDYEFHNLVLEKMTLEDQIQYFSAAVLVIAQHGAGLSNILWMNKGGSVIEFGFKSKTHFKRLSSSLGHKHFLFNYNECHININCNDFSNWLSQHKITNRFFKY